MHVDRVVALVERARGGAHEDESRITVGDVGVPTLLPAIASAQDAPPLSSVSATALARLRADIDGGGDFSVNAAAVRAKLGRAFGPRTSADISVSYVYEDWRFGTPSALGTTAPWGTVHQPSVGASVRYAYSDALAFLVAPQVDWNYETGASASEGLSYGSVVGAIYTYSKTLTVGVGAAAFRQVKPPHRVFPFVIVNWQITEKLLLSNPLEAGPTGGPGVELTYEISEPWDVGIRRRVSGHPLPAATRRAYLEWHRPGEGVPIFAHFAFSPSRELTVDFYAGAIVNGNMRVLDSNGATLSSSDYNTQPVLGIRAAYAF
jgi:hypothetical protein